MTVWDQLVGQDVVIGTLQRSVENPSHAWLFVGPPGSGRSNAATAFAAALQCETGGCGTCESCRLVLAGSHPDVRTIRTQRLSLGIDEVRGVVRTAALSPVRRGWQIVIIEDADRLTEPAGNALLKAIEEPGERTIWLLCAPTVEDVIVTIRSRTRAVVLNTPSPTAVAEFLQAQGVDGEVAAQAAANSQGHIGRARALATDPDVRDRRDQIVAIPEQLTGPAQALELAAKLISLAEAEAATLGTASDAEELGDLKTAYGVEDRGRKPREYASAAKALADDQKVRATRRKRDAVDRSMMELISVYRDAIVLQSGSQVPLVNDAAVVRRLSERTRPAENLSRIRAVQEAREQLLEFNVPPSLAVEALMCRLLLRSA